MTFVVNKIDSLVERLRLLIIVVLLAFSLNAAAHSYYDDDEEDYDGFYSEGVESYSDSNGEFDPFQQFKDDNQDPTCTMPWKRRHEGMNEFTEYDMPVKKYAPRGKFYRDSDDGIVDINKSNCRVIVFSKPVVNKDIFYFVAIKKYHDAFPKKDFIIPTEFNKFIEEKKQMILTSYEYGNLQNKFFGFAKTYSGDSFIYVLDTDNYFIKDGALIINSRGAHSSLIAPKNCQVVDLAKIAVEAILSPAIYKSIYQAQHNMYVDVRNANDWDFLVY
ncbi:MAG: hypothetical protein RLN62_05360 [Rickettsiales bacterium]